MQGTVDRAPADEGLGFIIGPNGEEYFFHRTALKGTDWEEPAAWIYNGATTRMCRAFRELAPPVPNAESWPSTTTRSLRDI